MSDTPSDITLLLGKANRGDRGAFDQLVDVLYTDLRSRAEAYMRRERGDHTLQPTALVNEVYLRLLDQKKLEFRDRTEFFAFAATTMRRILVEYARAKGSLKRGGGKNRIPLDDHLMAISNSGVDILALDEALKKLADFDERVARIVELRFFAGLTVEEVAGIIEVDPRTVKRDWRVAKTFLLDEMGGGDTLGEAGDTDGS